MTSQNKPQISLNYRNKDSLYGTRNKRCSESRMKTKPPSATDDAQNTCRTAACVILRVRKAQS